MNFTGLRYLQLCKEEIRIVSEGAAGCVRHGIAMCIPGDSGKGFNVFRYIHVYVYVYIYIWVLIKMKVSGEATIADQPRINRDPNGVNHGRVLSYATLFCAEDRQNMATYYSV